MKAEELEALKLKRGARVRLTTPTGNVEGTVVQVEGGWVGLQTREGTAMIRAGQIQGVLIHKD
jgi:hypothetical protein